MDTDLLMNSDKKHFLIVLKELSKLPKDKKYKLLDVGALERVIEKHVPENIEYFGLDVQGEQDYIVDLDKSKIPIKDNSFDIVMCLETLEHVIYPEKVMKELLRIAKPDAIFVLSMPNEYNFWARWKFLTNQQTETQIAFKTITNNLHIHSPRAKDVTKFFSDFINIDKTFYLWQSRKSRTKKGFYVTLDKAINKLAQTNPGLFSRVVMVIGHEKRL